MSEVRHVVLMKFKSGTPEEKLTELIEQYRGLPGKIETMKDFHWGTEAAVDDLAEGFTHGFISTFPKVADVAAYGPHPAHQAFVERLNPFLEKILVFDFEVR